MTDTFKRFDMAKPLRRQSLILRNFIKLVSIAQLKRHKTRIIRNGVDDLKPPYILLCNHNAFFDFFVAASCVYPFRANYVVAIDGFTMPVGKRGFISREKIMRAAGCICKRKFTNDIMLVRQIQRILENGDVAVLYPEARYSLCGTNAVLPDSLGKLCKLFKVPVVTLICHGHHVNSPFWNVGDKRLYTEAEFSLLYTTDELTRKPLAEINEGIRNRFTYDDFRWVKEKNIRIRSPLRAAGLHKVLYQCPVCRTEYQMASEDDRIFCKACNTTWTMAEDGSLSAEDGSGFSHIPDWYEWERSNVRAEVEAGKYGITLPVRVDSLPNSKGYINLGTGTMTHDGSGFHVEVRGDHGSFEMYKPVPSLYSCHIEYEYLNRFGDCIDLNTLQDTWYIYPKGSEFSVTKIALATEEQYEYDKRKKAQAVTQ
ncbi:MAG: 1-acyl-sn-glycerol-3-phosphate acyltransferase [Oscillospiraceae bacterium]|nr:1-acyl-sn-glycerol-3-phosphate acyltransferase [Oscillospiraceae bacterium]